MLNVYNYHTDPKSLKAPSDATVRQFKDERDEQMKHFTNDLYELQDDYDVRIASSTKPDGDIWYSASWVGRHRASRGKISFYIPANQFTVCILDETGQTVETLPDPHEMINLLADELNQDGAHAGYDEEEDDYEEDEYEDEEYDD